MKKEKLIGATSIPYLNDCFIQVLNIKQILDTKHKKEERYFSDFYNVTNDGVYFIDRIELDPFCENLGYQLINNRLVIYSYDIIVGKTHHAVKKIFKYYDVIDNININAKTPEIISELGFDLNDEEKNKLEFVETKLLKLEEYIDGLSKQADFTNITPLVDASKKERYYTSKQAFSSKMVLPISREKFAEYYIKMVTGADKNMIVNTSVINIKDYFDSNKENDIVKIKGLKK